MSDDRNLKTLVFGMTDGSNKRGRPHKERVDDIVAHFLVNMGYSIT